MAEEKGLIALNHCNNIANTIINKLGGTGYKPSEWREKVNLLGISNADKAEVLAGLTPEASGEEAGLIDLETINGLAEELNEKYTTIRGFKPSEMRGAISPMIPLEEKTASGSIAHYTDGAKNTPLTKCEVTLAPSVAGRNPASVSGSIVSFSDSAEVGLKACKVTIPASLSGVSSVNVERTGKNLMLLYTRASNNGISYSINSDGSLHREGTASGNSFNNGNATNYANCPYKFKAGTYTLTVSGNIDNNTYVQMGIFTASGASFPAQGITGEGSKTFTVSEDFGAWYYCKLNNGATVNDNVYIWLQAGDTSSAYEPYEAPKTYAADLGRTVYGGGVDIVNGSGTENYKKIALGELTWIKFGTNGDFYCQQITDLWYPSTGGTYRYGIGVSDEFEFVQGTPTDGQINAYFNTAYSGYRIFINKADYAERNSTEFKEYLQSINAHLVYKVNDATAEAFTFSRVPIVPKAGVNTMWSTDDISVDYYKDGYGYEEVKVYHEGKNIMPPPDGEAWEVGGISNATGRNVVNSGYRRTIGYIPVKGGANTWLIISGCTNAGTHDKLRIFRYDANKNYISYENESARYAIGEGVAYIRIRYGIADVTFEDAQMEYAFDASATATDYEPYTEPEEKTKDLGGIVYGGSYDFVDGKGSVKYGRVVYTGEASEAWAVTQASGIYRFYIRNDDVKAPESGRGVVYSSIGTYASSGYAVGTCYSSYSSSKVFIYYVPPQTVTTVEEFKAWLHDTPFDVVYEKAEPEAIEGTGEAIKSYFGVNTLWNEENDTTVGYYADIDLSSNTQNALNMVNLSQEEIE